MPSDDTRPRPGTPEDKMTPSADRIRELADEIERDGERDVADAVRRAADLPRPAPERE